MTNEDKNELILADISEIMRRYARRSITSGEAVNQILYVIAKKNLEQMDSEGEK